MNLKDLLSFPRMYEGLMALLGRDRPWSIYLRDVVQPRDGLRILDLGCGPAAILDYLPSNIHYVGVDIEQKYIDYARHKYGARGQFVCQSVDDYVVQAAGQFDLVLATALIHHLNDEQTSNLINSAKKALCSGGRFVTYDGCYTDDQSALARFFLSQDRGKFVRTTDHYLSLIRPIFPQADVWVRDDLLLIPYTIIMLNCTKDASEPKQAEAALAGARLPLSTGAHQAYLGD